MSILFSSNSAFLSIILWFVSLSTSSRFPAAWALAILCSYSSSRESIISCCCWSATFCIATLAPVALAILSLLSFCPRITPVTPPAISPRPAPIAVPIPGATAVPIIDPILTPIAPPANAPASPPATAPPNPKPRLLPMSPPVQLEVSNAEFRLVVIPSRLSSSIFILIPNGSVARFSPFGPSKEVSLALTSIPKL